MIDSQAQKNTRLLQIRKALKMTQQEMADLLGINRGNLSNIEKKKEGRNVPKDAMFILEREKCVNPEWFELVPPMFLERATLPGGDGKGVRYMKVDTADSFDETERDTIRKISVEEKLSFAMERNQEISDKAIAALEKNVQLLEEISKLKDLLLEREREIFHIKSDEKNGSNDPIGV